MPKAPTRAQHETQPTPIENPENESASAQPVEAGTVDQQQPIEPHPAEMVDTYRAERPVEDVAGEIEWSAASEHQGEKESENAGPATA